MNEHEHITFTEAELEASLASLGATELEQRLEYAPLLASIDAADPQAPEVSVCCSCKIPPDEIFGDGGVAPAIVGDPTPGSEFWGTGPVSGGGF